MVDSLEMLEIKEQEAIYENLSKDVLIVLESGEFSDLSIEEITKSIIIYRGGIPYKALKKKVNLEMLKIVKNVKQRYKPYYFRGQRSLDKIRKK